MSDIGIHGERTGEGGFRRGTVLLIVVIGIAAFAAMLVLSAYAPELRSGKNGGAHALSNAATGYSGLVRLAEATGRSPRILRHDYLHDSEDLVVLTPEKAATDLSEVMTARASKVTLVVLPKWDSQRDARKPAWVRVSGLEATSEPEGVLAPQWKLKVSRAKTMGQMLLTVPTHAPVAMRFPASAVSQFATGEGLEPIVTDAKGRMVLAKVPNAPWFVLADPDLLNNHGIADPRRAEAALALLDFLNSTDAEAIYFDVTLNGLGSTKSPLKLMFDPPFLAVTLAIAAALLLAGLQAIARFGVPLRPQRAIAFGKTALVDNSAALVRKAGREARLGGRYADMIRDRMAALLRLPPAMAAERVEGRLDALPSDRKFSTLAADAANAGTPEGVLAAARALHQWQQEAIK
ncbi:MAG TPA: hypothetical protein VFO45_09600 [Sphingomicrobium sp.]|nr:hypothetical protein [Sphingomicrobium sp.]